MAHQTPPLHPSDEATREQLDLAVEQGRALEHALREMTGHEAHGSETRAADYLVAWAVEHAEGMYAWEDGALAWHEPGEDNAHLEISVRDAADGRFVPGLTVRVTVLTTDGAEVGTHEQPFLWHPWLYHYGRNWRVPGEAEYSLRVHIDPPTFSRHDRRNGHRFVEPVDVVFDGVRIEPGQKHSAP